MEISKLELEVVPVHCYPDRFELAQPREYVGTEDDFPGGRELLIAVDGQLEFHVDGFLGMEPDWLLHPGMPLVPDFDSAPKRVTVQRCGCGVAGCGSIEVEITRIGSRVLWKDIVKDGRASDIGPFSFDAAQYEAEILRAHRHRPWEACTETVARLVTDGMQDLVDGRPVSFVWAAGRDEGVEISLMKWRPNPRAGGEITYGQVIALEEDELFDQRMKVFPVGGGDAGADASMVVDHIRSEDPSRWQRPDWWGHL